MEISQRNKELMRRINECGDDLGDVITWPDSESTNATVDNQIKVLKKLFKENGYPYGMIYLSMIHMAAIAYSATTNRDGVRHDGLKNAWLKIADIL
jgi:hypothetical protein